MTLDELDFSKEEPGAKPPIAELPPCAKELPPSLDKASYDYFDYALKLRTGEIIRFRSAKIHGDYATLEGVGEIPGGSDLPFIFDRGMDVRISDIVWCADAPNGS